MNEFWESKGGCTFHVGNRFLIFATMRTAWKRTDPSDQMWGKSVFVTKLGNLNTNLLIYSTNLLTRRKGNSGQQWNEEAMCQAGKQNKGDEGLQQLDYCHGQRETLREVQIQKVKREGCLSCRRAGFVAFFVWVMGQQNSCADQKWEIFWQVPVISILMKNKQIIPSDNFTFTGPSLPGRIDSAQCVREGQHRAQVIQELSEVHCQHLPNIGN